LQRQGCRAPSAGADISHIVFWNFGAGIAAAPEGFCCMQTAVKRRPISRSLINELTTGVARRESSVVIGPLHSGKSFVARRLEKNLARQGLNPLLIEFPAREPLRDESNIMSYVSNAPAELARCASVVELFDAIAESSHQYGGPATLIVSHLDGLSRDLARRFLIQIRSLSYAPDSRFTAIITAESHVFDLLLGPNSEFNCANEYILQGFDTELFSEGCATLQQTIGLRFPDPAAAIGRLYVLTGGSLYLLRQLLAACWQQRVAEGANPTGDVAIAEIERAGQLIASPGPDACPLFRHVMDIVDASPDSLVILERLLNDRRADSVLGQPHPFELAGIAYNHGGVLEFSSELMDSFIRGAFSCRRLGHLYALAGDWDTAFVKYELQNGRSTSTPSFQERVVTHEVMRRLREALKLTSRDRLEMLFENALKALFGVTRIFRIARNVAGTLDLPEPIQQSVSTAIQAGALSFSSEGIVGEILDNKTALVIWDDGAPVWLHEELKELLASYAIAVREEWQRERRTQLDRLRAALAGSITEILNLLYVKLLNPDDVLRHAGKQLVESASSIATAMFWLASDDAKTLRYVAGPPVAPATVCTDDDIHPVAIAYRGDARSLLIEDLLHWPENEREAIQKVLNGPAVLLPLRSGDTTVGVLGFAFHDGHTPEGNDEKHELEDFAQQLGAAVANGARIARLYAALDRIGEPIIVMDRNRKVVYYNAAAKMVHRSEPELAISDHLGLELGAEFEGGIQAAMDRQRFVSFPDQIAGKPYEGTVVYEPLLGKSDDLIGVLIHIQHKSHYADVLNAFRALERAASRDEALSKLLGVFQTLGHEWIRVYRVDNDELIPDRCIDPGRPEVQKTFQTFGAIRLPERSDSTTWKCINTRKPHVFSYDESRNDGDAFYTDLGLPVIVQNDPPEAVKLGKKPGDYWIDFPLMDGDNIFGKFTLPCRPTLTPERFQMFDVLARLVGESLASIATSGQQPEATAQLARDHLRRVQTELYERLGPIAAWRELMSAVLRSIELDPETATKYQDDLSAGLEAVYELADSLPLLTGVAST
jgi:hypothetical protein